MFSCPPHRERIPRKLENQPTPQTAILTFLRVTINTRFTWKSNLQGIKTKTKKKTIQRIAVMKELAETP